MSDDTYKFLITEYLYNNGKTHIDVLYDYVKAHINKNVGKTGKKYLREVVSNRYKGSEIFDYNFPFVNLKQKLIAKYNDLCNTFQEEINTAQKYFEGSTKTITVNKYERNIGAKLECLKRYGNDYKCQICGFKFSEKYGDEFKNKIHVHHIKPISEIGEKYQINPQTDLIPVCPNCHMILHSKGNDEVYTVDEVRMMILKNKNC